MIKIIYLEDMIFEDLIKEVEFKHSTNGLCYQYSNKLICIKIRKSLINRKLLFIGTLIYEYIHALIYLYWNNNPLHYFNEVIWIIIREIIIAIENIIKYERNYYNLYFKK